MAGAADLTLERLDLAPAGAAAKKLGKLPIAASLTDATVELTMEGASTLTLSISDPLWEVVTSGVLDARKDGELDDIDVQVDDRWFRLVKVEANTDGCTLTFEDRAVAYLRRHKSPLTMSRSTGTRAQFVRRMAREVKADPIDVFIPEAGEQQAIASPSSTSRSESTAAARARSKGVTAGKTLTVKGAKADREQIRNLETILAVADRLNASERATVAMVVAAIGEGTLRKGARNGTHVGVFQSNQIPATQLATQARHFLQGGRSFAAGGAIGAAKDHPDWTVGTIASHVEGSDQGGRFYDAFAAEARAAVSIYTGGGGRLKVSEADVTVAKEYAFRRKRNEDSWTCMQRLAEEVNWRCFVASGRLYFVSEDYLFASRAQLIVSRSSDGVRSLEFDWDVGKAVQEATLVAAADRWAIDPGQIVELEQAGPATGRWLVRSVTRSLFNDETTVTLSKPNLRKTEPAPETDTVDTTFATSTDSANVPDSVRKAYAAAVRIDAMKTRYSWGGGHNATFAPSGPNHGYDCSGFVSAILHAGGMLGTAMATGGLLSWGRAGQGKILTVWVRETGNPHASHTFATFKTAKGLVFVEAGGAESGHTGIHRPRSTAGFSPRHWPGT